MPNDERDLFDEAVSRVVDSSGLNSADAENFVLDIDRESYTAIRGEIEK